MQVGSFSVLWGKAVKESVQHVLLRMPAHHPAMEKNINRRKECDGMIGCLLLHGFTGSPFEVEPLAAHLERHGWKISTPLLPGHGVTKQEMRKVSWKDWVKRAENELVGMIAECEVVYLVGFSMGGIIAAYLSTKYPVKKLVLLSAAVFYPNPTQFVENLSVTFKTRDQKTFRGDLRRYWRKSLATPIRAVAHFRRLVRELRPMLDNVTVPTLIIQGGADDLVKPVSAQYIYERIQSEVKESCIFPDSNHMICHGRDQQEVLDIVDRFLLSSLA
jgi:carboxylesterase